MKLLPILAAFILLSCGNPESENNKDCTTPLNCLSKLYSYSQNSINSKALNMRIKDVSLNTFHEQDIDYISIKIKSSCTKQTLSFKGRMPYKSLSTFLQSSSETSNVTVKLDCLNNECEKLAVLIQDKLGAKFPLMYEFQGANIIELWNPNKNSQTFYPGLDQKSVCERVRTNNLITLKLFVNHDETREQLGFIDQFRYSKQANASENLFSSKCLSLNGSFQAKKFKHVKIPMRNSLRFELDTFEFEHDNFLTGLCKVDSSFKWDELSMFEYGDSRKGSVSNVKSSCHKIGGKISSKYATESLQLKNKQWLSKIKCKKFHSNFIKTL